MSTGGAAQLLQLRHRPSKPASDLGESGVQRPCGLPDGHVTNHLKMVSPTTLFKITANWWFWSWDGQEQYVQCANIQIYLHV